MYLHGNATSNRLQCYTLNNDQKYSVCGLIVANPKVFLSFFKKYLDYVNKHIAIKHAAH